jgi:hypothetical protein
MSKIFNFRNFLGVLVSRFHDTLLAFVHALLLSWKWRQEIASLVSLQIRLDDAYSVYHFLGTIEYIHHTSLAASQDCYNLPL